MTDTPTTTERKTRTITLTGRPPVRIVEADWPVIARASGDSYSGSDYARHQQALAQVECDEYTLIVRQHTDGRALVYGVLSAAIPAWGQPAHGEGHRAGALLPPGADLASAVRNVGESCDLPDALIHACIADLPAEDLT